MGGGGDGGTSARPGLELKTKILTAANCYKASGTDLVLLSTDHCNCCNDIGGIFLCNF